VADLSHLPPEVVYALRTGKIPPHLVESNHEPGDESELEDSDAERFRDRYHGMVGEAIADWLDEHPQCGNDIPPAERARIEEYCERQIQHQWRIFRRNRDSLDDHDDWRLPW
jgi:hypothetical protein